MDDVFFRLCVCLCAVPQVFVTTPESGLAIYVYELLIRRMLSIAKKDGWLPLEWIPHINYSTLRCAYDCSPPCDVFDSISN